MRGAWPVWIAALAALAVYLVMACWSLPAIADAAGGQQPFDLRPFGYSSEAARAFLTSLNDEGRAFYLQVQHRLDIAFPPLLALSVSLAAVRFLPRGATRSGLAAAALGAMLADYAENLQVARMLRAVPEAVTDGMIRAASLTTTAKSLLVTVALTGVVLAIIARLRRGSGERP
jgi:hypothetical protein